MSANIEYYKEQLEHGRHIEVQRSSVAGLAVAFSGAIIGELLKHPLTREMLPYTVTLCGVNLVALLLSAKLYERFRLHNAVARRVRDHIDKNLKCFAERLNAKLRRSIPFYSGCAYM